jgi:type IV secretion system protein VirB5
MTLDPLPTTEAGQKFLELYAEPVVTNTYLKVAILVLAAVALFLYIGRRQQPCV